MNSNTQTRVRWIGKPIVFAVCLTPFLFLAGAVFGLWDGELGANPAETLLNHFGTLGLRFTLFTLAVTPLRRLTGLTWLAQFRRMIGLFAAFYVSMHFLVYFGLDQGFALGPVIEDIIKRPYITLGIIALMLLLAMTVTSTRGMRRRLGKRWQKLHNSVYVVGILGVWHFWWQVKKDITEPLIYALVLAALLGIRVWWRVQSKRRATRPVATTPRVAG